MNEKDEAEIERIEIQEWIESLDYVLQQDNPDRVRRLLRRLQLRAAEAGVHLPFSANTAYVNAIPRHEQPPYPGNREIERRIKRIIRWNAMAMVVRANREEHGIGGHISTYASASTLYEVGFSHFFQGNRGNHSGDQIYFQGHAAPGIYSRAFLEGRLTAQQLENFRRELKPGGGLSSYPHPWLMPDFWEFPTVSMGLGPIMAIYQARFNRYLEDRGLKTNTGKVVAFLGDGETDEPEALGSISLAGREKLDNLIFIVNCNLQRLDGPVRGNGKIIQELEAGFRGAGWNVLKVIWGDKWDPLLEKDKDGLLLNRMEEAMDGDYQKYSVESGSYIRDHFFGTDPRLKEMVAHLSDEAIQKLNRGGHDPEKVYAAYKAAWSHKKQPTVILAKTIKGYGLGESGEGKNITHQQKKLNEEELRAYRTRLNIPISDKEVSDAPFYKPDKNSREIHYLHERRKALGGYLPQRTADSAAFESPDSELFEEFYKGSDGREVSTTMAFVRILSKLLKDKNVGALVAPIVPDEARTFGMETLFRQVGIYSHVGQTYEPVDRDTLLYYKEAKDGQIFEEGITESGAMSSFIAAGTAYSVHGVNAIPFFIYYSMFGLQRIGDLVWAAGDMRCKGFMIGGTAGRTTLAGEGLQHQDGNSHLLAYPPPTLRAYDIAYAYELAAVIEDGIRRMYAEKEDIFYYLTVENEPYAMPAAPDGCRDGILKGMYKVKSSEKKKAPFCANLLGSGAILNEAIKAQKILQERYDVAAEVWSVTSYKALHCDALEAERWNMLHPTQKPKTPYVTKLLNDSPGVVVAASDYVKAVPYSIARWVPRAMIALGTDGFGRSESRTALRDFFEVDARYIALAALQALAGEKRIGEAVVQKALADLDINPNKPNPANS